jgi:hypothetical protein
MINIPINIPINVPCIRHFPGYCEHGKERSGFIKNKVREKVTAYIPFIHDMDCIENTASNSSSVVVCVFVAAGTCLQDRWLAADVSSCSIIPAFRRFGEHADTQTARWSYKLTFIYFKIRKIGWKGNILTSWVTVSFSEKVSSDFVCRFVR